MANLIISVYLRASRPHDRELRVFYGYAVSAVLRVGEAQSWGMGGGVVQC